MSSARRYTIDSRVSPDPELESFGWMLRIVPRIDEAVDVWYLEWHMEDLKRALLVHHLS